MDVCVRCLKRQRGEKKTNKEKTLDNALQGSRCDAVLLCIGIKRGKEICHLLGENTNDKVHKLGKLLVAQRVQLLDVAVQLLVRGRCTTSKVELRHCEKGGWRERTRGSKKETKKRGKAFSRSSKKTKKEEKSLQKRQKKKNQP